MLDQTTREAAARELESLAGPVKLVLFTQDQECRYCTEARTLANEVAELSPSLSVEVLDFVRDRQRAEELGIDKIPALAVLGREDHGIRFFGFPGGYEFTSLLEAVKSAGADAPVISADTAALLKKLAGPVEIQVFVTPTCPYCPQAVVTAHRLARSSPLVSAAMVESIEFPHLAQRYGVRSVPMVILNGAPGFTGGLPEADFARMVLEAAAQGAT